jgi:hypothetical protein
MTPAPHPWRHALAGWPDARRLAWGERANALIDLGMPWELAEEQAFREAAAPPDPAPIAAGAAPAPPARRGKTKQAATLFT